MAIRTTSGPVPADQFTGTTLAHEHLAIDLRTSQDSAAILGHEEDIVAELTTAREQYGLCLVVDLTCRGMGRDVVRIDRIAKAAGIHVVAATGYYYERFHPEHVARLDADELAAGLIEEIDNGIGETGIRPGVLGEIGSHGVDPTPQEATSLRAAAIAASATGLSVATHAHLGQGALGQLDLLTGQGLAPERISIGHQDLCSQSSQHRKIAAEGAYVAFDTVGKNSYQPDESRLRLLLDLIEAGHGDRVLLSNDVSRDPYLVACGGTGYAHVLGWFAHRLRAEGVDEDTMDLMFRRNTLRFLLADEDQ